MKETYNWWTDPKNAEQVKRISWWDHPENKTTIDFPLAIVEDHGHWVVAGSEETKQLIGEDLCHCGSGESKEDAIRNFFALTRLSIDFERERAMRYQCWVPFRKGPWSHKGGRWLAVFGIHFNFRYGKNMKHGWYIPFTKLNISVRNEWMTYKRWRQSKSTP